MPAILPLQYLQEPGGDVRRNPSGQGDASGGEGAGLTKQRRRCRLAREAQQRP